MFHFSSFKVGFSEPMLRVEYLKQISLKRDHNCKETLMTLRNIAAATTVFLIVQGDFVSKKPWLMEMEMGYRIETET